METSGFMRAEVGILNQYKGILRSHSLLVAFRERPAYDGILNTVLFDQELKLVTLKLRKTVAYENSFKSVFVQQISISTRVRAVGYPSTIEGETSNILNLRTGLWARCSTSLPINSEESLGRHETPRQTSPEHFTII